DGLFDLAPRYAVAIADIHAGRPRRQSRNRLTPRTNKDYRGLGQLQVIRTCRDAWLAGYPSARRMASAPAFMAASCRPTMSWGGKSPAQPKRLPPPPWNT